METFSALLAICAGNSPVPVNSPHKGQWRWALMFSLICAWINGWVNNREAGDLRRNRAHYDVNVLDFFGWHYVIIGICRSSYYTHSFRKYFQTFAFQNWVRNAPGTGGFISQRAYQLELWCLSGWSVNNPFNKWSGYRWLKTSRPPCDIGLIYIYYHIIEYCNAIVRPRLWAPSLLFPCPMVFYCYSLKDAIASHPPSWRLQIECCLLESLRRM